MYMTAHFLGLGCFTPQYISYIAAVSFIGRGNSNTWRKLPTCRKSLINFLSLSWLSTGTSTNSDVVLIRKRNVNGSGIIFIRYVQSKNIVQQKIYKIAHSYTLMFSKALMTAIIW
jgi:hypothetical protein